MANNHHYFFAVKLPYEVKTYLNRWVQMHDAHYPFKRWVHPEDYHITLAFLGFAEKEMLDQVLSKVADLLKNEDSFELTLNKLGIFGPAKSPRIFWAGVKESDEINLLQKKVFKACLDTGFKLDKKPFKPHITIARKWGIEKPLEHEKLPELKNSEGGDFSFTISEVALYETHLDQSPKYREYTLFSL
ncbi:RNA 2',3'-cyclic phosphodiesterase [Ureibacillus manganicus]|uniref:RNA 2',3'-cyclic phosphodiesterase n=1 Tax=Ureibacillus manganicus DSM 26584 TaxID=1384049 RepID=A0A0A3I9C7_9BACL|nr:RNA 2',3'-cyclic phosphodiesterase [Ureibacillus manganicus]KGR79383.1 hypothetical protein CD29_06730 [Ureibacillus manganicus DSM 26584]